MIPTSTSLQILPTSTPIQNLHDVIPSPFSSTLTVGISASISMFMTLVIILVVVIWVYIRRKATNQKQDFEHQDRQYSIDREENTQSQSQANANLYEQVHLSTSTEFIPTAENKSISNIPWQPQADLQGTYSCIDPRHSKPVSQEIEYDPMYTVVGKGNNKEQCNDSHDGLPVLATTNNKASATNDSEPKLVEDTHKDMYAVVNKKLRVEKEESALPISSHVIEKLCIPADQKNPNSSTVIINDKRASPISPHRVEELYTVVKYKPKEDENEDIAPPIPPHTVEELYTAIMKKPKGNAEAEEQAPPIPPYTVEELYTAIMEKPKGNAEAEEQAPPIPPYTVEELYTAVQKKPKGADTVYSEEEAPPIPPYTVDKLSCNSGNNK